MSLQEPDLTVMRKKCMAFFYTGRKKSAKRITLYVDFLKTAKYLCRTFPTV